MPSPASSPSIPLSSPRPPVVALGDLLAPAANETRSSSPPVSASRPAAVEAAAPLAPLTVSPATAVTPVTVEPPPALAASPVPAPTAEPPTAPAPIAPAPTAPAPTALALVAGSATASPVPVVAVRPRPILASDALREELAPWSPLTRLGRQLTGGGAALLVGGSVVLGLWGGSETAMRCALEGGVLAVGALAAAVAPLTYVARAHATAGLGAVVLVAGLFGHGPTAALVVGAGTSLAWEVARVLAASLLPAALMLRAHYRAFARTRILLGWGLALALPFVMRSAYLVLLGSSWVERLGAATSVASVLLALLGFMGSHTTAGGTLWAACLLGSLAFDIGTRSALPLDGAWRIDHLVTAATFLVGAGLTALGLFQSLAHRLAPDARRAIDERCRRRGIAHL